MDETGGNPIRLLYISSGLFGRDLRKEGKHPIMSGNYPCIMFDVHPVMAGCRPCDFLI